MERNVAFLSFFLAFVLGWIAIVSGCVYVPIPGPVKGTIVQDERLEGLLGSSKSEVRNQLGIPQHELKYPDEQRTLFIYAGSSSFGYLMATDGTTFAGATWASTTYQCTLLQFDASEQLERYLIVFRESDTDCVRESWRLSDRP